jgi:hypothetical protein
LIPPRAIEKVAFINALNVIGAELNEAVGLLDRPSLIEIEDQKSALLQVIGIVGELIAEPTPLAPIRAAKKFADIDSDCLLRFGKLIALARMSRRKLVESTVTQILQEYRQATTTGGQDPDKPGAAMIVFGESVAARAEDLGTALDWAVTQKPALVSQLRDLALTVNPISPGYPPPTLHDSVCELLNATYLTSDLTLGLVEGFGEVFKAEPIGRLHLERLEMTPVGIEKGELVYSVPLAPKETVNITHKEWATKASEFQDLVSDYIEGYSEEGVIEKREMAYSADTQSKHSTAFSTSATLSASYSNVTLSSSVGYNSSSDDQQAVKDSKNHSSTITRKASERIKKEHQTSFKVASASGTEDQAVRVITNPREDATMRVDYHRMMRKWKVDSIRYGLRMTYDLVIPSPGIDLLRKINEIRRLDVQLGKKFTFPMTVTDIVPGKLPGLMKEFQAHIDPPPEAPSPLPIVYNHGFIPADDARTATWKLDLEEVPANCQIKAAHISAEVAWWVDEHTDWGLDFHVLGAETNPAPNKDYSGRYEIDLNDLVGKSGKLSIVYTTTNASTWLIKGWLELELNDSALFDWQLKTWNALYEAAKNAFAENQRVLQERRDRLQDELTQFDALTLRRMEREEIMKGVLQWLLGPTFTAAAASVQNLYTKADADGLLEEEYLDPEEFDFQNKENWGKVLSYGEFIKFIQNAIEWENVLYFNYPYFWESAKNWPFKLFLYHYDSFHQTFLRSGAARVVLTIRPGFEENFATFMQSGAFGILGKTTPYVSIAKEIQNFAMTNYPGITPANPDVEARPLLYPEQRKAWSDMQKLMLLLEAYLKVKGHYPSTTDGLAVLDPKLDPNLKLTGVPQKDPWGHAYAYACPGKSGEYDLVCYGADGVAGGEGIKADITSYAEGSVVATWYEYTPTSALDIAIDAKLVDMA